MVSAKLFLISVYGFAATAAIGVAPPTMAVMMPASGVAAVGPGSWIGARWGNNYAASWNAVNANWAALNWANLNTNPNWACSLPGAHCHNNPSWAAAGNRGDRSQPPAAVNWMNTNRNPNWACSLPGAQCHNNPHWANRYG